MAKTPRARKEKAKVIGYSKLKMQNMAGISMLEELHYPTYRGRFSQSTGCSWYRCVEEIIMACFL